MSKCQNLDHFYKTMKNASKLRWLRMKMCVGDNRGEGTQELQPSFFIPFKQLRVLEMEGFVDLQHLPCEIGTLEMLEYLTLIECHALELVPETLGKLTSLVKLNLSMCKSLNELPETLGNLTSLVELNLYHCSSLNELPETLGNLTSLVKLNLSMCECNVLKYYEIQEACSTQP
jgi:hypothetical protein